MTVGDNCDRHGETGSICECDGICGERRYGCSNGESFGTDVYDGELQHESDGDVTGVDADDTERA